MKPSAFGSIFIVVCVCSSGTICLSQRNAGRFHWDWHKIEKDNWETIEQSKGLSARERADLTNTVASQLRPFMLDMGLESEKDLLTAAAQTRIKPVDLRGKGAEDLFAQGGSGDVCSPTGNCPSWVFRKDGDRYSLILQRGATQGFTIQPNMTNGFHDLVLDQHASATEQGLTLYRFDGSKYRAVACYDANWEILGKDGEPLELREPRVTPCSSH